MTKNDLIKVRVSLLEYARHTGFEATESLRIIDEELAAEPQQPVTHYGIIDPDYARVFTMARCLAWQEGYALAMHGSFTRDLDLIAVPWTDSACDHEHLVRRIVQAADLEIHHAAGEKPHGRLAYTLMFKGFGDPRFVDLSVVQRQTAPPSREWQGLSDDERQYCKAKAVQGLQDYVRFGGQKPDEIAVIIEAALKAKNEVKP